MSHTQQRPPQEESCVGDHSGNLAARYCLSAKVQCLAFHDSRKLRESTAGPLGLCGTRHASLWSASGAPSGASLGAKGQLATLVTRPDIIHAVTSDRESWSRMDEIRRRIREDYLQPGERVALRAELAFLEALAGRGDQGLPEPGAVPEELPSVSPSATPGTATFLDVRRPEGPLKP
jgi:hypothetical protein